MTRRARVEEPSKRAGDGRVPRCGEIDEKSQSRRFYCCSSVSMVSRLFPLVLLLALLRLSLRLGLLFLRLGSASILRLRRPSPPRGIKIIDIDHRRCRRRRWVWCVGHEELLSRPRKKRPAKAAFSFAAFAGRSTRRDTRASLDTCERLFNMFFAITVAFWLRILSIRRIVSKRQSRHSVVGVVVPTGDTLWPPPNLRRP